MRGGERLHSADEQSLMPLVELSPHLIEVDGRVRGIELMDVPLDENGIPKRVEFLRQVLGTIATDHYWTGYLDVHHLAWPGADYRKIKGDEDRYMGLKYRGCASLKVRVPRQLHNYFHKVTLEPPMPHPDVMHQWLVEQGQIDRLYDTIKPSSLHWIDADNDTKDEWRYSSYMAKLEDMRDGELGLMPDREYLSALELSDARQALRCLARVRGVSNSRKSKREFFNKAA